MVTDSVWEVPRTMGLPPFTDSFWTTTPVSAEAAGAVTTEAESARAPARTAPMDFMRLNPPLVRACPGRESPPAAGMAGGGRTCHPRRSALSLLLSGFRADNDR
ncbi:hypothetical protein GCM10010320_68730 [Streptomyces caelestis]|nr:hypothetical protein GCM10010320_68730 [Streptomyces caelestis]